MASLDPRLPVFDVLAEPMRAHGVDKEAIGKRVDELLTARRPRAEPRQPLPATLLRRAAPAHRHRQGARPRAQADRPRRAGRRPRRVDPGRRHQPPRPAARRAQPLLPVRRPRPRRRPPHRRSRRRDVPRADRRDRRRRLRVRHARPTRTPRRCCRRCRSPTRRRSGRGRGSCSRATCPARWSVRRDAASGPAARSSSRSPTTSSSAASTRIRAAGVGSRSPGRLPLPGSGQRVLTQVSFRRDEPSAAGGVKATRAGRLRCRSATGPIGGIE